MQISPQGNTLQRVGIMEGRINAGEKERKEGVWAKEEDRGGGRRKEEMKNERFL